MAALRSLNDDPCPVPRRSAVRRRPAWLDETDRADARVRDEDWREHLDWQREHDQEAAMYGDRDHDQRIGWSKEDAA